MAIVIYEHKNPATTTLLHCITFHRKDGIVTGFAKLIDKIHGGNSNHHVFEYITYKFEESYFDQNYKIYTGGAVYRSEWEKPDIIYNLREIEGNSKQTWGGP